MKRLASGLHSSRTPKAALSGFALLSGLACAGEPAMDGEQELFVPVQAKLAEFFKTIPEYPFQEGSSLSAGGINYNSLKAMKALKMLEELEQRFPVGR